MPNYYFRVPAGRYCNGYGEATELPDCDAARQEALKIWRDLVPGIAAELASQAKWKMQVADERGNILIEIRTEVEVAT
jgi:hypothetical protein